MRIIRPRPLRPLSSILHPRALAALTPGGCLVLAFCASARADALPPVATPLQPVTNIYQGVTLVDPYQWLEDASSSAVREWTHAENERTRAYFAHLPYRDGLAQELTQLSSEESAAYFGLAWKKGRIFALRFKPPAQQPVLVRLSSLEPPALWRPIFDPNAYNTNGTTAIDWSVPSLDGRLVAVSLSEGGSEQGTLHFFDVDSGKELGDAIPRVQFPTGGGSAAWVGQAGGSAEPGQSPAILYTRYPHQGERPEKDLNFYQQVYFHRLGTSPSEDKYEIGQDFPRIAEISLETSGDGHWILATVANGDGGDFAHYLRNSAGHWQQLTHFEDGVKHARFGRDEALYLLSLKTRRMAKSCGCPSTTPTWPAPRLLRPKARA